jgi:hypothetical protein
MGLRGFILVFWEAGQINPLQGGIKNEEIILLLMGLKVSYRFMKYFYEILL